MNLSIVGLKDLIDFFEKTLIKGIVYSSYIIYGRQGIGKKRLAHEISKILLCEENKGHYKGAYCNHCSSCAKIDKDMHPDLRIITPIKDMIRIEEAREIIRFLDFAPHEGIYKIIIIDDAHMMNVQAQNALLKTIEEPPGSSIHFFITNNKSAILPTIQSRSSLLKAKAPLLEEMRAFQKEEEQSAYLFDYAKASGLSDVIAEIKDKEALRKFSNTLLLELKRMIEENNDSEEVSKLFDLLDYLMLIPRKIKENCNVPLTVTNIYTRLRSIYVGS